MKYITRTIKTTLVKPSEISFEMNGIKLVELKPFTFDGTPNKENILKAVRKEYGKMKQYKIDFEIVERYYRMSIEDFIANAEEVTKEEASETEE